MNLEQQKERALTFRPAARSQADQRQRCVPKVDAGDVEGDVSKWLEHEVSFDDRGGGPQVAIQAESDTTAANEKKYAITSTSCLRATKSRRFASTTT